MAPSPANASAPLISEEAQKKTAAENEQKAKEEAAKRAASDAADKVVRQKAERERQAAMAAEERARKARARADELEELARVRARQCITGRIVVALGSGETRRIAFEKVRLTRVPYPITVSEEEKAYLEDTDRDSAQGKIDALTRIAAWVKVKDGIADVAVTKTDAEGRFRFVGVPSGRFYILCDLSLTKNYAGWDAKVIVPHGGSTSVELNNTNMTYSFWCADTIY